ncbi:MAG: response regulator [Oligoflexus sp.]|nr:response regulator [Oligoflexus sp.]
MNKHDGKSAATVNEKRYVLIDDDPTFRAILLRAAHMYGIQVDVYESLEELGAVGLLSRYDVAIVDYDLGAVNGLEIAEYLDILCSNTPMILVSAKDRRLNARQWPQSIKQFIPKSMGYSYILEQAERWAQEPLVPDFKRAI